MRTIHIERCCEQDLSAITHLNQQDLGYPETTLELVMANFERIKDSANDAVFVGKLDDKVVGYVHAQAYISIYNPPCVNILGIAVNQSVRGMGIGKALLQEVENWTQSLGYTLVRLNSNVIRTQAHRFYEHCGYESHKTQKNFYKVL